MRSSVLFAAVTLVLGCLAATSVVSADDLPGDVTQLLDDGVRLRTEGRDAEALDKFQAAYRLRGEPRFLAQIALAEQALGHSARAYTHLGEALSHREDAWISQWRTELEDTLKQIERELGSVKVACNVTGASVAVDDRDLGTTPLPPFRAQPGPLTVRVQAAGYLPVTQTVKVVRAQSVRVAIDLVRAPPSEPVVAAALTEPVVVAPAVAPDAPGVAVDGPAVRRNPRWLIGVGAGAASSIAGGITYAIAGGKADALKQDCYDVHCDDAEREERRQTVRALDRTSAALIGIGIVTMAASSIGYFVSPRAGAAPTVQGVNLSAAVGTTSAVLYGTMEF